LVGAVILFAAGFLLGCPQFDALGGDANLNPNPTSRIRAFKIRKRLQIKAGI
jgi:hypothetical protein